VRNYSAAGNAVCAWEEGQGGRGEVGDCVVGLSGERVDASLIHRPSSHRPLSPNTEMRTRIVEMTETENADCQRKREEEAMSKETSRL